MRRALVPAIAVGLVLGLVAEEVGSGWDDPRLWAPDLLVGWTLLASAVLAWWWRRAPAVAGLLAATGVTWFLGFTAETLYWHRGPLVHLLLTYPSGRPAGRLSAVAVGVGYLVAAVPALWGDPAKAVPMALALVVVAARESRTAPPLERAPRGTALTGAALLGTAIVASAVLPALLGFDAVLPSLHAYQAAVAGVGVLLLARLPHRSPEALADAVVDPSDQPDSSLQRRLAAAVADPTLVLAFWSPTTSRFRTDAGQVVDPDAPGAGRAVLVLAHQDRPLAALVHDPQSLRDTDMVEAVACAVRLADTNATLRERVGQVYGQIFASRRRLLLAADVELRDLDQRLRDGPERLLRDLDRRLDALDDGQDEAPTAARTHCREAQDDLRRLSQGLHPRDLDRGGLVAAVRAAASRVPAGTVTDVSVQALPPTMPAEVEVTAYFVVAEALANVAKYAGSHRVRVELSCPSDTLLVRVSDDGVGGAQPSGGTGLQGLADRVASLGGTFDVHSPPGGGTAVIASLPVRSGP